MTSASEFGRDHGLIHEAVVTGRKVGADADFWKGLAHDEDRFAMIVAVAYGNARIVPNELPKKVIVLPRYFGTIGQAMEPFYHLGPVRPTFAMYERAEVLFAAIRNVEISTEGTFAIVRLRDFWPTSRPIPNIPMSRRFLDNAYLARFGLKLCSFADALMLRVAYEDQPVNERVILGAEPIPERGGSAYFLMLEKDHDALAIKTVTDSYPEPPYDLDTKFLFKLRPWAF